MKEKRGIIFAGGIIGLLSVALVYLGNPKNMGACIACFLRDIAGAVGLHRAEVVQYIRPEVIGIVLGAFIIALFTKEFKVKGGSSPFLRFILGAIVMIGALVFLGCPLRMVLRIAGGDLNAVVGLLGFAAGIFVGIQFLNRGFTLKRNYNLTTAEGYAMPVIAIMLLVLLISAPAFIFFSAKGPGSMHAPIWFALAAGLIIGIVAQRTRLCMVGGIRDLIMFKDSYLMWGFISIFVVTLIGNLVLGDFKLGFVEQPIAHNDALWNFMGMLVAGWGSVLLGGCPLRQLILAGEGNADSAITVMGMIVGAAFAHNFKLASSGEGPTGNGKIAIFIGIAILLGISYFCMNKSFNISKSKADSKGGVSIG
ncbi:MULTISPECIES: YedE family putative selenium transporter [Clostridium]|uniref:Membrane protein n=1 Tax=Clostridium sulfidigenes TaxID=318464 RepID=A0A084JHP8_9CLOT|nr:YedE family putative selenium transporter [Clostridium sulfidigenes]HAR86438.1 YedE-related selenium metabolism membrane protein [Clostridium sp.]HAY3874609.1 YedE-related selenium metabolism membrane protein [Escherichia coli]KEZ88482.1 membrane protein [Clostridium sulfidigenes]MBE6060320.1 YedE-related selenium metabolism membrane protein [Clostridium sulfidigenes]HBA05284.1 YedE-related selenium metabolism membrane protein [Clostridium sp.]